ncbi:MAG: twin-arginine translocation signal domain-containing protein, partial [Bacteroidales bacterium]|nr:twin-arginine translocation signal domain-containing protein [Bacteroidales bacterium]
MKRRDFIKDSAILVAAAGAGNALKAADRSFASLRMT